MNLRILTHNHISRVHDNIDRGEAPTFPGNLAVTNLVVLVNSNVKARFEHLAVPALEDPFMSIPWPIQYLLTEMGVIMNNDTRFLKRISPQEYKDRMDDSLIIHILI